MKIEHSTGIAAVLLKMPPPELARESAFNPEKAKALADARASSETAASEAATAALEHKKAESRQLWRDT